MCLNFRVSPLRPVFKSSGLTSQSEEARSTKLSYYRVLISFSNPSRLLSKSIFFNLIIVSFRVLSSKPTRQNEVKIRVTNQGYWCFPIASSAEFSVMQSACFGTGAFKLLVEVTNSLISVLTLLCASIVVKLARIIYTAVELI